MIGPGLMGEKELAAPNQKLENFGALAFLLLHPGVLSSLTNINIATIVIVMMIN